MILLTTSDYFPRLGGLSTFTQNIEKVLIDLGCEYKLFHWKNYKEIEGLNEVDLSRYQLIINIHPQFAWLSKHNHEKMINFIHGSEILMTSPSIIKKIVKKFNKKKYFNKLENCHLNIFISEFTLLKTARVGLTVNYSRDIILHNCIDTKDAQYIEKTIGNKLTFSCIVRNVAHKNLWGAVRFCELVSEVTGKKVEILVPKNSNINSSKIEIQELNDSSDKIRDEAYKCSHFNLLLSEDQSTKGFFEGFGLTVLEAARLGTPSIVMDSGGLPEAVHHAETGWVVSEVSINEVRKIFLDLNDLKYQEISLACYEHTVKSHSLKEYKKIIELLASQRGVA